MPPHSTLRMAVLLAGLLSATPALCQSWSIMPGATHAITPPSIAGEQIGASTLGCIDGQLILETGAGVSIDVFTQRGDAAAISASGQRFATQAVQLAHGTGIIVPPGAIAALKAGRQMEIEFPTSDRMVRATLPLNGSSRALASLEQRCGLAPAPSSSQPATAQGGAKVGEIQRLQIALADELAPECRRSGGKNVVFESGAVRQEGSRNPAHPDVVFDFHHILCNGASGLSAVGVGYCGAGPCLQKRFSYGPNGYALSEEFYQ